MADLLTPIAGNLVPITFGNADMALSFALQALAATGAAPTMLTADEAIAAGDFVNIHASSGAKIRKADASDDTRPADAFAPAAIAGAASGTVLMPGQVLTGLAGLTPGADYWLSETAGLITATQPTTTGNLVQKVGKALSATELFFSPQPGTTL